MPEPTTETQSEPSTVPLPQPIRTQLSDFSHFTGSLDKTETPPSAGPGAFDPTVIPPSHKSRTIILCFDGTGDQFDTDNSNIIQFFSMLKKDDKSQQVVYYQAGIGTYTIPEIATPFWSNVQKKIDMAIGNHLDAHVMGGYEFLMENYHAEDKICIFGFSRGAYTARALAGMLHKVGLLPAGNHQQIPFAYKMFSRDDPTGWKQSNAFKKAFSMNVEIEFVGVWDTVCSVGIVPRTLPFTASNTSIRYFRHAISLDEHRAKFKANYYHLRHPEDEKGIKPGEMPRSNQRFPHYHRKNHQHHHKSRMHSDEEYDDGLTETNVLEVWFAGCHCDIGGGSVPNGTRNSLARIPLRWMIRQCFDVKTGIQFHYDSFIDIGLDPNTVYPIVTKRPAALIPSADTVAEAKVSAHTVEPSDATLTNEAEASPITASTFKSEEDEELVDALCPIYDQLKLAKAWWILELLPLRHHAQNRENLSWNPYWQVNLGHARRIPGPVRERKEKIRVHRSVKIRLEAEGLEGGKYEPLAKFEHLDFEWED
ncbi:hypothetical protein DFH94DRAFT_732636 [Russula ochroleuca]|jgi:uncharacterized protein (DUF2235 family)|uniref:T6SS Phospholipase effector Tle1-like catalytic domain-containing protein n=1 Tax=Russula ochroleuca TaxID=152965 RepID=A0A9P5MY57_9AGAM|nr:hypothetical protein DFH94DRAFT_732636 [Russula ochroleuca]